MEDHVFSPRFLTTIKTNTNINILGEMATLEVTLGIGLLLNSPKVFLHGTRWKEVK